MMNKIENSEALKNVWKWKEEIHNDVKIFKLEDRFYEIHKMAEKIRFQRTVLK